MKNYDVIVIGSGGGAKIISPAAKLGLKVAAIEAAALGGTCLNRGCIPSKMLIHPADVAVEIRQAAKFDLEGPGISRVNFSRLVERISRTVDGDSRQIKESYSKNPNIDFYHGHGQFVSDHVVEVLGEQLTAPKIIIATGARPAIPAITGLTGTPFMTSTEALRRTQLPKRLVVLGGGYIAVELGHAYGALGTDVEFLVRSRLLRHEDAQVAQAFHDVFSKQHKIHLGAVPTLVEYQDQQFTVTFQTADGDEDWVMADSLLVATGIVPNTDQLGLEKTAIERHHNGFIQVDSYLQTTVPGVYALGDCVGNYLYRHSVNFEGEYLFAQLFEGAAHKPLHYPPMPHAVFTHPQVAGVGMTEEDVKAKGIDYVVGLNHYKNSAMGMALMSEHGFVKIIIGRKDKKILGAHIIGDEASDMIHMLIALMTMNATLDDLLKMIYIHPALPEIVRNAARKARAELEKPTAKTAGV